MRIVRKNQTLSAPIAARNSQPFGFVLPEGLAKMYEILKINRDAKKDYSMLTECMTIIAKSDGIYYTISDGIIIPRYVAYTADTSGYAIPMNKKRMTK